MGAAQGPQSGKEGGPGTAHMAGCGAESDSSHSRFRRAVCTPLSWPRGLPPSLLHPQVTNRILTDTPAAALGPCGRDRPQARPQFL